MKRRPSIFGPMALLALVLAVVNEWDWPATQLDWTLCGILVGVVIIWLNSCARNAPRDPDEPTALQQRIQAMQTITRPAPTQAERRRPSVDGEAL